MLNSHTSGTCACVAQRLPEITTSFLVASPNLYVLEFPVIVSSITKTGEIRFIWQDRKACSMELASFPGLPTVQFLIACSMQKRRGKAWSILSHEWCQCLTRYIEGGGVPHRRMNLRPYFVVFAPSARVSNVREAKMYRFWFKTKYVCMKCVLLMAPSVYLCRHWRHSRDKMDQAFPSVFAYCKQAGWWEGLGRRLPRRY